MVQIEKGVPMPEIRPGGGRRPKYPWLKLEIGDSFILPIEKIKIHNARHLVQETEKRYNLKFVTEKTDAGLRVWRAK